MKEIIANLLEKELKIKKEEILNLIEIPPQQEMGDYAFPCFILAGKFKKSPVQIAAELAKKLKLPENIEKAEAKGPYLNFFVDEKILAEKILDVDEKFGRENKKEKILLEHTSLNPNASPHVGRTRNSIIADSIKRILEFQGYQVETHFYVNDVSKQVAMLAMNFKPKDNFNDLLKKYVEINQKIEQSPELEKHVFELLNKFEKNDKDIVNLFKKIVGIAINGQREILSSIGIEFDYFDHESKYIEAGKNILRELEKTGKLFKDEEGRMVLNQDGTGLEKMMKSPVLVLTRNNGTGLYVLRDLAYTIDKCSRGKNIIILGEDQKLYFEQLKQALILLKKPYPSVIHYSFVLLKDVGKMSTRRGEVVLLEEFISEAVKKAKEIAVEKKTKGSPEKIGIGAIKYAMLRNDNDKNITFDWEQALNFEGDSGPYLQYAYARAGSILKKAKKSNGKIKIGKLENAETNLIKEILKFPDVVEQAGKSLSPSIITNYSFSLAQMFNEFYHACPVIGNKEEAFRLKLVETFRIVMKNSLWLLGIEVMEEM